VPRATDPSDGLPGPVPVAAPTRVAAFLDAAPDGPVRVLHACADSVHLEVGGQAVGVSVAGAPGLPHALRTNLRELPSPGSSATGPSAYVDSGLLHLGGRTLVVARLVDVRAPRIDAARTPKTSPVADQGTPRSPGAGLVAVPARIDPASVAELVGRGDGLTPLGDDVLCGWLAGHRAAGVATSAVDDAVRRALPRTTTLSATLLACALVGEVADLAGDYLRALGTPSEAAARTALTGLGHSSGEGLAHGIDLALGELNGRAAA
jgi:hypothetical protein